ncbi:LLM class flavin-dependent oxidoreductase [Thalassospiraceae bacterium LMO-JJ14]|nr:LLM class flavin-dependent oxidoreductase [Thalassospiraceae bacterium LMO-JJ14]
MKLDLFLELASPPWISKTPADVIRDTVEIAVAAEAAGMDTLWLPEHHFLEGYSNAAAPDMLLAAVSQATKRINLGFAIIPLPLHDPVRVAERLATLDALAPGRVRWGVGRGVTVTELAGFGINPAESREIFEAKFAQLQDILSTGHAERDAQRLPIYPPVPGGLDQGWIAAVSPETFTFAAQQGLNVMTGPFKPWAFVNADLARYRKACAGGQTSFTLSVYCEQDHKAARERARRGIVWVYRRLFEIAKPMLSKQVEGYEHYRQLGWTVPLLDKMLSIAVLERLGLAAVGDPEHVTARLSALETAGLDRVSLVCGGGDLLPDEVARSLKLLGEAWRQRAGGLSDVRKAVTA